MKPSSLPARVCWCLARSLILVLLACSPITLWAQTYTFTTLAGLPRVAGSTDGTRVGALFSFPTDLAVDGSGNIFVADFDNHTIRKITPAGVVTTIAGRAGVAGSTNGPASVARFDHPTGIATDEAGNIYVAGGNLIRKITAAGIVTTLAGDGTNSYRDGIGTAAGFNSPTGLAVDRAGNLFVADRFASTIRKITPAAVVTTFAGDFMASGSADGPATSARFNSPNAVAVDRAGNIYIADTHNSTIRKIMADGIVTTLAGSAGEAGSADGTGASARFYFPLGITVDGSGNLYVSEGASATIRRITSSGVVTTIAGLAGQTGSSDGTGDAVRFHGAAGLAVDGNGTVYVADTGSNTIRKGVPSASLPAGPTARLSNLSVRTTMATGQTLIVGIVVDGGSHDVLVRAVGPTLAAFGLSAAMTDPRLEIYQGQTVLFANDDWPSYLEWPFHSLGAFPFVVGSKDAAILQSIEGARSVQARGAGAGTLLVEAYGLGEATAARMINVSARNRVGTGDDILIAGFNVSGTGTKRLLVRAIGPGLAGFGVAGHLVDPKLEIFDGHGVKLTENDNWTPGLATTFAAVGAFALPATSRDAALLTVMEPGSYTVQVRGADGGTGEALVEIYEVP